MKCAIQPESLELVTRNLPIYSGRSIQTKFGVMKTGDPRWREPHTIRRWEPYDPSWLVEIARQRETKMPWLSESLSRCRSAFWASRAYLAFVNQDTANQPGSPWQFVENIILENTCEGDLVLDILSDRRVGGVEFLSRL